MNIYLVGYMGSGKSTVGKRLAHKLNFTHLDLDDFFEESYKISVINFFRKYDEAAFRKIESNMLKKNLGLNHHVTSTGGGTPCFNNNMDWIKQHGFSVYIQMHPHSLFTRLKHAKRLRPRTSFLNDEELKKRITDDLLTREKFYLQADLTIKGENIDIDALAEELLNKISNG